MYQLSIIALFHQHEQQQVQVEAEEVTLLALVEHVQHHQFRVLMVVELQVRKLVEAEVEQVS